MHAGDDEEDDEEDDKRRRADDREHPGRPANGGRLNASIRFKLIDVNVTARQDLKESRMNWDVASVMT